MLGVKSRGERKGSRSWGPAWLEVGRVRRDPKEPEGMMGDRLPLPPPLTDTSGWEGRAGEEEK